MALGNKPKPTSKLNEIVKNQDRPASEFAAMDTRTRQNHNFPKVKKRASLKGVLRYRILTNFALMFLFPLVAMRV